jgi:hypothetical protein
MHLSDEQMGVIAGVADQGNALLVAGKVFELRFTAPNQELIRIMNVVEVGLPNRASAVHAFKIKPGAAEVPQGTDVLPFLERASVVGDVMGDELAEEGPARWNSGILRAQFSVNSLTSLKRTAGSAVFKQGVAAALLRAQFRKQPSKAAIARIRQSRTLTENYVWIC